MVLTFGFPSPEDFVKGFFEAFTKFLGGTAEEAIEKALRSITENTPELNPSSLLMELYDGALAISLILGVVASAIQLIRVVRLGEWSSFVDFAKIVPITYLFGATLPVLAFVIARFLGDIHRGIVEWILGSPLDENTFDFRLDAGFDLFSVIIGWMGGALLQLESYLLIKLMPMSLLVIIITFALRWFGFLGNGLFTFAVGLMCAQLFGTTAMVLVLCLFWLGAPASVFDASYLAVAMLTTALVPFVVFFAYYKFGFSQRVSGVMESRLVTSQIAARNQAYGAEGGRSGVASKVAMAGAGAVAGALIARETSGGRPDDVSALDHQRSRASDRMMLGASMAARSHPVTSVALLMGSKIIKPRKEGVGGD